jgi:hypothetical protein
VSARRRHDTPGGSGWTGRVRVGGGGVVVALLLLGLLAGVASPGFPVRGAAAAGRAVAGALGGGAGPAPAAAAGEAGQGPHIGASDAALADIPPGYLGRYVTAAGTCPALTWQVLAAIGKIESDHGRSSAPGVRDGINRAGCCAGPMQFNLTTARQHLGHLGDRGAGFGPTRPTRSRRPPASCAATVWPAPTGSARTPAPTSSGRPPCTWPSSATTTPAGTCTRW